MPAVASEILRDSFYLPFAGRAGRERMFASMSIRVRRYAGSHSDSLRRVIRVEQRFEVPIDGSLVRGRMDLVIRVQVAPTPDGVEIIDIKTSEKRPPMPQHKNQLRLYGEAARIMGMNPLRLTIHDLDSDDGAAVLVEADDKELDLFKEQICRWVHGIRNRSFTARIGPGCTACDFEGLCG